MLIDKNSRSSMRLQKFVLFDKMTFFIYDAATTNTNPKT